MAISIISFIVVFSIVTLAHELGHYYFSKKAGIRVLELGLGFGPRLYGRSVNRTIYTLNLFPLGGFIRIAGINPEEEKKEEKYTAKESYENKRPGQKFMSVFGGPAGNIVLAFIIFYIMFTVTGVPKEISNEIAMVSPGSVAEKIGLKAGDKVVELAGKKISQMADAVERIHKSPGKQLVLKVERNGKYFSATAVPQLNKKLNIGLIGISLKPVYIRTNPVSALIESMKQVLVTAGSIAYVVGMLLIGKISVLDLAGPVGIAQFTGQVAGQGMVPLLSFTAFLSINLGVINLIPIPALDGGRLVFIVIEAARKKAVSMEMENKIHSVGLTLLLILMAILTVNDILRIFRK